MAAAVPPVEALPPPVAPPPRQRLRRAGPWRRRRAHRLRQPLLEAGQGLTALRLSLAPQQHWQQLEGGLGVRTVTHVVTVGCLLTKGPGRAARAAFAAGEVDLLLPVDQASFKLTSLTRTAALAGSPSPPYANQARLFLDSERQHY